MPFNKIDKQTKDAWAETWEHISMEEIMSIFNNRRAVETMAWLESILPKNELILEGGCGLCQFVIYLKAKGFNMVGMDYNSGPLIKAKANYPHIDVVVGNVESIPFGNETFGAYLSFGVLEHFTSGPQKAIHEAYRTLKDGGQFIVFIPQCTIWMKLTWPIRLLKRNNFIRKLFGLVPSRHYWEQYFHRDELIEMMEEEGFYVREVRPTDHDHALLTIFPFFKSKVGMDEVTPLGAKVSDWCRRWMPWWTNAQLVMVCIKLRSTTQGEKYSLGILS